MEKGEIMDTGTYKYLFNKYPQVFEKILKEEEEQKIKLAEKEFANFQNQLN